MSKPNDPVRTYSAEIHKYEPKVSKFYIHHCQCSNITRTCYLKNIFKLPNISRNETELPVSAITCLQAIKNKTVNFGPTIITLQKTSMHLWENLFTELFRAASRSHYYLKCLAIQGTDLCSLICWRRKYNRKKCNRNNLL